MNQVIPFSKLTEKPDEVRVHRCPFCGSKNARGVREQLEDGSLGSFNIECIDCLSAGPKHPTLEGAARTWNRRT